MAWLATPMETFVELHYANVLQLFDERNRVRGGTEGQQFGLSRLWEYGQTRTAMRQLSGVLSLTADQCQHPASDQDRRQNGALCRVAYWQQYNGLLAAVMNSLINIETAVWVLVSRIGALRLKLATQ